MSKRRDREAIQLGWHPLRSAGSAIQASIYRTRTALLPVPGQRAPERDDLAGTLRQVAGQLRDLFAPEGRCQQRDDRVRSRRLERLALVDQKVVLDDERDEVDALAGCGPLEAEARVGGARGDRRRDREVVRFLVVEAADRRRIDLVALEQLLEQRARSGRGRAIDESQPRQVFDAA